MTGFNLGEQGIEKKTMEIFGKIFSLYHANPNKAKAVENMLVDCVGILQALRLTRSTFDIIAGFYPAVSEAITLHFESIVANSESFQSVIGECAWETLMAQISTSC